MVAMDVMAVWLRRSSLYGASGGDVWPVGSPACCSVGNLQAAWAIAPSAAANDNADNAVDDPRTNHSEAAAAARAGIALDLSACALAGLWKRRGRTGTK